MKILLTGAGGFIGKNYLKDTVSSKIFTVSNTITDSKKIYKNYAGDLSDIDFVKKIASEKFDAIIHTAWIGLPKRTTDLNLKNLNMYKRIIDIFSASQDTKHVFLGSCLEYGNLIGRVSENNKGIEIDNFGQTKLDLLNYVKLSGISYSWIRLFYLFGPYQHINSLTRSLHRKVLKKQNISLINPNKTHDFIYIKDAVAFIDKISGTNIISSVYNCGSGAPVSVGHIANTILKIMGHNFQFLEQPEPALSADTTKAKKDFNWSPSYSIYSGLSETIGMVKND
jgi:nucleoside-diphosphate-sugar epimerase